MTVKFDSVPVPRGQKVADNQREPQAKKTLTVTWGKYEATVKEKVVIKGVLSSGTCNPMGIEIWVYCDGNKHRRVTGATVQGNNIIAVWDVYPYRPGDFTIGEYHAEITVGNVEPAKTAKPLKIVAPGANTNVKNSPRRLINSGKQDGFDY